MLWVDVEHDAFSIDKSSARPFGGTGKNMYQPNVFTYPPNTAIYPSNEGEYQSNRSLPANDALSPAE
ncbi:hypothetical protein ACW9JV_12190 [Salibacterium sp. K-3]